MDFRKLFLVSKREYITRVRTKTFIWTTILVPVGLILLIVIPAALTLLESDTKYKIAVKDESGAIVERLTEINSERYFPTNSPDDTLRSLIMRETIDAFLLVSEENILQDIDPTMVYSGGGIDFVRSVRDDMRDALQAERLSRIDVSADVRETLSKRPNLATRKLTEEGKETEEDSLALFAFGYIIAFVIYGTMFMYGSMIMRGVIEEKSNRIVEIIASSIKPVELMIGKVVGVGAMGLTQYGIWIVATLGITAASAPIVALFTGGETQQEAQAAASSFSMPEIDPLFWVYFVLFFLFGYLIYSALFAAVGSAVDNEADSQQLMFPVSIPILLAIVILPKVSTDPDSTLAVVASLIPLFSPILMVARIPITDVPLWQILTSFGLMFITFMLFMKLSAKIYRVGILMYGKKPSFKEIYKWLRYR